jgi:hypothetical protein
MRQLRKENILMKCELQRGVNTPLGHLVSVQTVDQGVYWVTTVEHGGYMIDRALAQATLSSGACAIGDPSDEQWLCFEEDCAWAVVVYEHPEWAVQSLESTMRHALLWLTQEYPDYLQTRGIQPGEVMKEKK